MAHDLPGGTELDPVFPVPLPVAVGVGCVVRRRPAFALALEPGPPGSRVQAVAHAREVLQGLDRGPAQAQARLDVEAVEPADVSALQSDIWRQWLVVFVLLFLAGIAYVVWE